MLNFFVGLGPGQNLAGQMEMDNRVFDFHQMAVHKRTTMLAHCNLKQNMWLC